MSYKRKSDEKKRLKKLWDETKSGYLAGAYFDEERNRYIRYYKSENKFYRDWKKQFHKKLRHSETVSNKEYDIWKVI